MTKNNKSIEGVNILRDKISSKKMKNITCSNKTSCVKNSTGITLIALVITIVVLLILAGVSLNIALRRKWNI